MVVEDELPCRISAGFNLGSDYVSYMELNFVTVGSVEGRCLDKRSGEEP